MNYPGVVLQCALLSNQCDKVNSTGSVGCDIHDEFIVFSVVIQCHNDFINCSYDRSGNCRGIDCDANKCPYVAANQNRTVVGSLQLSNDACTVHVSATNAMGNMIISTAVETANCKFIYTCTSV